MFGKSLVFAAVLCLIAGLAPAAENTVPREGTDAISVPQLVNYQGKLTDAVGNPLTGNYNMKFEIFDDALAGSSFWNETQNNVPVASGLFNVIMGSSSYITNLPDGPECWLEITVAGEKITPRVRLVSVPYTYKAAKAEDANKLGAVAAASYATQAWVNGQNFERQANKNAANGYCGLNASALVDVNRGGTGRAALTANNILIGNGTGAVSLVPPSAGYLQWTGSTFEWSTPAGGVQSVTASAPLYSSAGANPNISLTGTVPVANGGTGRATLTANYLLYGNATSAVGMLAPSAGYLNWNGSVFSWSTPGGVGGGGTSGRGARWTAASTIGDGAMYDDGTQVSVGTGTSANYAIYGYKNTATAGDAGVCGYNAGTSGATFGVYGSSASSAGYGVYGYSSVASMGGVYGYSDNADGNGVVGYAPGATGGWGVFGTGGNAGGAFTGTTYGAYGYTTAGSGVYGKASTGYGVYGVTTSATGYGVWGAYSTARYGYIGGPSYGVYGYNVTATAGFAGVYGYNAAATLAGYGVFGLSASSAGYGVYGYNSHATAPAYAVYGYTAASTNYGFGTNGLIAEQGAALSTRYAGISHNQDASTITTGTLPIARGGTNATAVIQGGAIYGASTTAYASTAAGTAGRALISNAAAAPTWDFPRALGAATNTPTELTGTGFFKWVSVSITNTALSAYGTTTLTATLSGALTSDYIMIGGGSSLTNGVGLCGGWISASNTLMLKFICGSSAGNTGVGPYYVLLIRP